MVIPHHQAHPNQTEQPNITQPATPSYILSCASHLRHQSIPSSSTPTPLLYHAVSSRIQMPLFTSTLPGIFPLKPTRFVCPLHEPPFVKLCHILPNTPPVAFCSLHAAFRSAALASCDVRLYWVRPAYWPAEDCMD